MENVETIFTKHFTKQKHHAMVYLRPFKDSTASSSQQEDISYLQGTYASYATHVDYILYGCCPKHVLYDSIYIKFGRVKLTEFQAWSCFVYVVVVTTIIRLAPNLFSSLNQDFNFSPGIHVILLRYLGKRILLDFCIFYRCANKAMEV